MPHDFIVDLSIAVQVMARCPRTTRRYLNQYLKSSVMQYELTRGTGLMHLHVYQIINGFLSVRFCH